jgi:hypothetical protein
MLTGSTLYLVVKRWLRSSCRKWQTAAAVGNCLDLGQVLHLEPTHQVVLSMEVPLAATHRDTLECREILPV